MKIKNYYLFAVLTILLISINLCLAQNDDPSRQVVANSTYIPFKTVRDEYGKKFAQSYFVIQVKIRNDKLDKQFIVQKVEVLFDRRQCRYAQLVDETFNRDECENLFDKYFFVTNLKEPIGRDDVIATGEADLNRSNRNVGFRILAFTSSIGSILTGFNGLIGRDGIKGINVLGTTVTAAANALFPDTANQKLENLKNALPSGNIIIKGGGGSEIINIFVPTERVFWKDSWKEYIKPAPTSEFEIYKFKVFLDTIMLSSATGVLVDNNAPKVEVRSDDSLRRQAEKFRLIAESTNEEELRAETFRATAELLQRNLASPNQAVRDEATAKLRNIVKELNNEPRFKTFLTTGGRSITDQSAGADILSVIKDLMRNLNDEILENKVMDVVIQRGR